MHFSNLTLLPITRKLNMHTHVNLLYNTNIFSYHKNIFLMSILYNTNTDCQSIFRIGALVVNCISTIKNG